MSTSPHMPDLTPANPSTSRPAAPTEPESQPPAQLDFAELIATLYEGLWLIIPAVLLSVGFGVFKAYTATPVYRADSLVQVEDQGGQMQGLKEVSEMFGGGEATASTEIELIRSRTVVAQVVDALHLDIEATPHYFPVIGKALARRHTGKGVAPPKFGFDRHAWGGEHIAIEQLVVPGELEGKPLRLVAGEGEAFSLYDPEGDLLVEGKVGTPATSQGGEIDILVTALAARPNTAFKVAKHSKMSAVRTLRNGLTVRETGRNTGIISLTLDGTDPNKIARSLDEVMNAYVSQNIERRAAEAQKTLEFINSQLPGQKKLLDDAELKLNQYRQKTGQMDLSLEAQAIVARSGDLEKSLSELTLQRDALRQHYTETHPTVAALDKQLNQLRRQKQSIEDSAKALPEAELQMVRLLRDVTVANTLYVLLLDKAQELNLVKFGTVGNVRVVDTAALQPFVVSPKKKRILLLSLMAGLAIGCVLAVGHKKVFGGGVADPDLLENAFTLPVFASIPFSDKQEAMIRAFKGGKEPLKVLAQTDGSDLAVESVRSLRTSLQFALASAPNNVIVVGGSRPGIGKSFVSVNLAHVLAAMGKKVLLVDGDLRKGHLHRYFGPKREGGLSELVSGTKTIDEAIRSTSVPNLSFLSSGVIPPNPSELLSSDKFTDLVKKLSAKFDLVIIDAPPILAVTDAVLLSRVAGVNLLVVKSGLQPLREIGQSVTRLQQSGVRPSGFVFNAVPLRDRMYGYGKYRYHYQYDYR